MPSNIIRIWVESDNHIPIQDKYFEDAKIKCMQDLKPDVYINCGDLFDGYAVSRFEKEPDRLFGGKFTLQSEFNSAQNYLKEVCKLTTKQHLLIGNHEFRIQKFLATQAPGLYDLKVLDFKNASGLPPSFDVHKYGEIFRYGNVWFAHGDHTKSGTAPALWYLNNMGPRNFVMGHWHRPEFRIKTIPDDYGKEKTFMSTVLGHSSDTKKQTYTLNPSWCLGFAIIDMWQVNRKDRFSLYPVLAPNGKFSFGGKVYGR